MFFAQQAEQTFAFNINRPPHLSFNTKWLDILFSQICWHLLSLLCNLCCVVVGNITTTSLLTEITLKILRCKQLTPMAGGRTPIWKQRGSSSVSLRGARFRILLDSRSQISLIRNYTTWPICSTELHLWEFKIVWIGQLLSIFASLTKKYRFTLKNVKQTLRAAFNTAQG